MDQDQEKFLKYWVSGIFAGIKDLDEPAREKLFSACGKACGDSYTVAIFREAKVKKKTLDEFLSRLGERFPDSNYELIDGNQIKVTYQNCGCDLVRMGWVKNPLLCQCSVKNLEHNFSQGAGMSVRAELRQSILSGDENCEFIVRMI